MPNIKSAKKRVLVNTKKTEQNKIIRSALKTAIKKAELLIKDGELDQAKIAVNEAFSAIDSACSKNIIHKNKANNKKAKLAKKLSAALKNAGVTEDVAPVAVEELAPVVEEVKEEAPAKKTTTRKPRAKKVEATEEK